MAKTVTFLQLSPEFGGTKFGPFEGIEIRLGSDPTQSDITLPETLGVIPQHVKLLKQQDDSFILAPVDRAAPIYHYRSSGGKPKLVTAPMAVQSGDAFALVTPEGPRFHIVVEKDAKAIAEQAKESEGPGWGGLKAPGAARLKRGLIAEIRRRGFAAVFTTRLGNLGMRTWQMVKTGQIFSPIYIVSGMIMLSGWLGAGGAACAAINFKRSQGTAITQLSDCKDQLGVASGPDGELGDPTVPDLTRLVLEDPEWKNSMIADGDLYAAYAQQLKTVLAQETKYRWVFTREGSPYTRFKNALESAGLPPALVRVLAFAAATPSLERTWSIINDSEGQEVCGRGPVGLTYRQALNLGLVVQPDALVENQLAASNDLVEQRAALDATIRAAGTEYEYRDDLIQTAGAEVQGGMACLWVDGTDERDDLKKIASAFQRKIGASATRALPSEGEAHWIAARLVMLFAQDFKAISLDGLEFDARTAPSITMSTLDVKQSRRSYAIQEAARLMARAAAIPCLARFDKEQREVPSWFMEQPPKLGSCAILKAYVEYDRL